MRLAVSVSAAATLEWVDWFNRQRLLEPIGYIPPAEVEAKYYATQQETGYCRATQSRSPQKFPGRFSDMEISVFLARFWGSLFIILGFSTIGAKLLGRVIKYTEDRAITVSTGYITFLLGLATVVAHSLWVADWRVAITVVGWVTLFKGIEKIAFPDRINKVAQRFKGQQTFWGFVILFIGAWFFWMSF